MRTAFVPCIHPLFPQAAVLRETVLREPLGLPSCDWNDRDPFARHLIVEADGTVIGYGRLTIRGQEAQLEHVCVDPSQRKSGIGRRIVQELIARARYEDLALVWVNARFTANGFYEGLGFRQAGPVYKDAETHLPHRRMELRL